MADGNELLIKISADANNVKKAFDDVREQTEDLESKLSTIAKISAVGFAALTAEIGFSLKAFAEADATARKLNQTLQSQGIYSKALEEQYGSYAKAVQAATGIDDDAVTAAQAVAQNYLGQTKITQDLTFAIADLSQAKGIDLSSAAMLVAKTIGTETNALAREGLQLDETMTKTERYAKTLEFLKGRYEGQAAAANEGLGTLRALDTAFGNLQEGIGQRFAPAAEKAIALLTNLFTAISSNEELVNLTVALTTAGLAITGLGIGIPLVVTGLGVMRAAMVAAGIATTTTKLAVNALVGATGIGLVVVAITEMALHWDKVWPRIVAVTSAAIDVMSHSFEAFGKVVAGAATFNLSLIKEGMELFKNTIVKGATDAFGALPIAAEAAGKAQNEALKASADKRAAEEALNESRKMAEAKATQDLAILQLNNASAQAIEIKKAEIETLKQLLKSQNDEEKALLQQKYEQLRESEAGQFLLDTERRAEFKQLEADARAETNTLELSDMTLFQQQKRAQIEATLLTDSEAQQKYLNDTLTQQVNSNNLRLVEERKYGAMYAQIHQALNTDEVKGFKSATSELVALTQSKNAGLKAIGKAAAISQIVIKTGESAMNIYAGFSAIPIIGPALGAVGAAAAVLFGAEQVNNVTAAASGGLITGGIPGRDSVPLLAMPGELVVPTRNYEEVVSAVADQRGGRQDNRPAQPQEQGFAEVVISMKDQFVELLEAKIVERRKLGISLISESTFA